MEAVSLPLGPHGCCCEGGSANSSAHAASAEVSLQSGPVPTERPTGYGAGHQEIVYAPQMVEGAGEHLKRQQAGSSPASASDICGRIPQGLGRSPRRKGHQQTLGCPQAGPAYQCLRAKGNLSGPLAFSAKAAGPPRDALVRTNSTMAAAYVNRQASMGSPRLCRIAHKLWTWAYTRFLSLRAMHVLGVVNVAATSRELEVAPIWHRFSRAVADLFASRDSLPAVLLCGEGLSPWHRSHGTPVASGAALCFSPIQPSAQPAAEDQSGGGPCDPGGARLGSHDMVLMGDTTPGQDTMETSSSLRPAEPGTEDPVSSLPSTAQSLGLTPERAGLLDMGLTS